MKKISTVLIVVVFGLLCSCRKSDHFDPMQDGPHLKDTLINNSIPQIVLKN